MGKDEFNGEKLLAKCHLRLIQGRGDTRNQCALTKSQLYIRSRRGEETYRLTDVVGARRSWRRPWGWAVLGLSLLVCSAILGLGQLQSPPPPQPPASRTTWLGGGPPPQPSVDSPDWAAPSEPAPAPTPESAAVSLGSMLFSLLLFGGGVYFTLLGFGRQERLVVELNSGNIREFQVTDVTEDYTRFVEALNKKLA